MENKRAESWNEMGSACKIPSLCVSNFNSIQFTAAADGGGCDFSICVFIFDLWVCPNEPNTHQNHSSPNQKCDIITRNTQQTEKFRFSIDLLFYPFGFFFLISNLLLFVVSEWVSDWLCVSVFEKKKCSLLYVLFKFSYCWWCCCYWSRSYAPHIRVYLFTSFRFVWRRWRNVF